MFKLDTKGTSYLIGIMDKENFIGHVYDGKNCGITELGICSGHRNLLLFLL